METLLSIIGVLFGVILGIVAGIFIGTERMRKAIEEQSVGNLRIDRSEPDEPPRPFLEITNGSIETIAKMKVVILKVIDKSYLSSN